MKDPRMWLGCLKNIWKPVELGNQGKNIPKETRDDENELGIWKIHKATIEQQKMLKFISKNEAMANIWKKGVLLSKTEEQNQKQEEEWETQ